MRRAAAMLLVWLIVAGVALSGLELAQERPAAQPLHRVVVTTSTSSTTTTTTTTVPATTTTRTTTPAPPRPAIRHEPPMPRPRPSHLLDPLSCDQAAAFLLTIVQPNAGAHCGTMQDPVHDKAETLWWSDGRVEVVFRVDRCCIRFDAVHEAAHVIAGYDADHGPSWRRVLDELSARYQ